MDIVVANGFVMESCTFFSREYNCCVLHNTRCMCEDYNPRNSKPMTNYDLLIRKSPEELAEFIGNDPMYGICPNNCQNDLDRPCKVCVLKWLRKEACS